MNCSSRNILRRHLFRLKVGRKIYNVLMVNEKGTLVWSSSIFVVCDMSIPLNGGFGSQLQCLEVE